MFNSKPGLVLLVLLTLPQLALAQNASVESEASVEIVSGEAMLIPGAGPAECDIAATDAEDEAAHLLRVADCVQRQEPVLALAMAKMAVRSAERASNATRLDQAKDAEARFRSATATVRIEPTDDILERRTTLNGAPLDLERHTEVVVAPGSVRLRSSQVSSPGEVGQHETIVYAERS